MATPRRGRSAVSAARGSGHPGGVPPPPEVHLSAQYWPPVPGVSEALLQGQPAPGRLPGSAGGTSHTPGLATPRPSPSLCRGQALLAWLGTVPSARPGLHLRPPGPSRLWPQPGSPAFRTGWAPPGGAGESECPHGAQPWRLPGAAWSGLVRLAPVLSRAEGRREAVRALPPHLSHTGLAGRFPGQRGLA